LPRGWPSRSTPRWRPPRSGSPSLAPSLSSGRAGPPGAREPASARGGIRRRAKDGSDCQGSSPETMLWAAILRASAQARDIRGLLPWEARIAFVPACLSALLASLRSVRAVLAGRVAAWSMSRSALARFAVTPAGRVCPAHSEPDGATAHVARAGIQGEGGGGG